MSAPCDVKLRPLEREDLRFVHQLDNNASVMRYWFEEPYEAFVELSDLYDKHIHDQSERRFVVECEGEKAGLVELVEINHVHRRAEFQIIISPEHQGKGLASRAARLAMDYGFNVLNLYKLYLIVDKENEKAIHIYRKLGFMVEGELIHEFFINGEYRNTIRMCIFQHQHLSVQSTPSKDLRKRMDYSAVSMLNDKPLGNVTQSCDYDRHNNPVSCDLTITDDSVKPAVEHKYTIKNTIEYY
ncbi:spermidine N1-acetyltransferase [Enterobacter roggenkampii]|uniref:spermidine N1-acetyltransferase n=2 Tax=Bacteria TaxID=2 RepID=UPI00094087FB|nr:spermidine N1-acetyltransferase [Enterobacter roggenkampii]